MTVSHHLPPPQLQPYIAAAHGYQVPANPVGIHRWLPSRHVTLVIELNSPLRVSGPAGTVASHGVVGGLHTSPALIDASRPQEGLQYGLSPLACEAILGVPAGAIGGLAVDLADVVGAAADQLIDRVAGTQDWRERFRLVDSALLGRLGDGPSTDLALSQAWRLIFDAGGAVAGRPRRRSCRLQPQASVGALPPRHRRDAETSGSHRKVRGGTCDVALPAASRVSADRRRLWLRRPGALRSRMDGPCRLHGDNLAT